MSRWGSKKAKRVLAALLRIGWALKRQGGTSHKVLQRDGWTNYILHFTMEKKSGRECWPAWLRKQD
jgi:predicted RNA binding protein YcfA (HicA-like mRNA interferase family)